MIDVRQFFNNRRDLSWRNLKKYLPLSILVLGVLIVVGGVAAVVVKSRSNSSDSRVEVAGAKAKQDINQDFSMPIRGEDDQEITSIKLTLESVELRDEIIVQGKRASSVKGRTFLILNLKLTNDFDRGISMAIKDYFRLTVNGNENELLAADIHNDPVVIQPKSTKYSRIGFPINDADKQMVLWVGELGGEKQKLELNLK